MSSRRQHSRRSAASRLVAVALLLVGSAWAQPDDASAAGTCSVTGWGGFTSCTRVGLDQWARSHSRSVAKPGSDCPPLTETLTCERAWPSKPTDATAAAQQASTSVLVALPLALASALSWPAGVPPTNPGMSLTPDLASALTAGRKLWQQQASSTDLSMCTAFNGPVQMLKDGPVVGDQGGNAPLAAATSATSSRASQAAARDAFAALAKATARQPAAVRPQSLLQAFRDAVITPADPAASQPAAGGGVLPPPSVDATATVTWDGSSSMAVSITPAGSRMTPAASVLAGQGLQDGMSSLAPWLHVQGGKQGVSEAAAPVLALEMAFDGAQGAATFTSVLPNAAAEAAAGPPGRSSHGHLLLPITHHLTGMYGLALGSLASKAALMRLPTTDAVLKTAAGSGVTQMALTLAGAWTPANLTAALGVPLLSAPGQAAGAFSVSEPTLLFSANPSALYVAMTTSIPALAVDNAPATLNIRPGGRAALALYEPCQPVAGLQLSDVLLHMGPDGNLTGSAAGQLASTVVSAVASVSPASSGRGMPGDVLSLVMTAETAVAAGSLADVITIITHRPPPALLQALRALQGDDGIGSTAGPPTKPMQFSSVTLTYSRPSLDARRRPPGQHGRDSPDTGFEMVAVPDVDAAPALKQVLDAIDLSGDSIALRAGGRGAGGVGVAAFGLAAAEPYRLELPAPFANAGPTILSLDVSASARSGVPGTPVLTGSMAAQVSLPGAAGAGNSAVLDLGSVTITTPTAVVGVQAAGGDVPVTAHLAGRTMSRVSLAGFPFLDFGAQDVSAAAGFKPSRLLSLNMSGAVSAFGVAGRAVFNSSATVAGGRQTPAEPSEGMTFVGRLPAVDVPLMARSLGAQVPLGAVGAQLRAARVAFPSAASVLRRRQAAADSQQDATAAAMDVAAELRVCGMASPVSFELSPEAGGSFSGTFVPIQINRALLPAISAGVSAALRAAQKTVAAARAAAGNRAATNAVLDDARAELAKAQQQAALASTIFEAARKEAADTLGSAAVFAESASVAFHDTRSQAGAVLQAARNEFNRADAAFNAAKTLAYQTLNAAKQTYSDALAKHEAAVTSSQQRVDGLLEQTNKLRAAYNTANQRCSPAAEAQAECRTAAASWTAYREAASRLDAAQVSLQQAATIGGTASALAAAKAEFDSRQNSAEAVLTGPEWVARGEAAAKLDLAAAAMQGAEAGPMAQQLQDAHAGLEAAQARLSATLLPSGAQLAALATARGAVRAAVAGVRTATAAPLLAAEDLAAASADLTDVLAGVAVAAAAAAADSDGAATAATAPLFRFDRISVGFNVAAGAPLMLGVSYSGSVAAPAGATSQLLSGRFQVDASGSSDDLTVLLVDLLRDDVLAAVRASRRSLAALL